MDSWECQCCTALNEQTKATCWKCRQARALSDVIILEKEGASIAERQAAAAIHQQLQQARAAAISLADQLARAGKLDFRCLLAPYVGAAIGMNLKDPVKVSNVTLLNVQADHFTVEHEGILVRTPYTQILRLTETIPGSKVGLSAFSRSYDLVVEVFQMVVYKGAVGVGFSIPM